MSVERVPPQDVDLEQSVLGAIMLDPKEAYPLAASLITPEVFYLGGHRDMYAIMGELHARGVPPDSASVIAELKTRGLTERVGGVSNVLGMLTSVISSAHIEAHCRVLVEKQSLRETIHKCAEAMDECYSGELQCEEIIGRLARDAQVIQARGDSTTAVGIGSVGDMYWENLDSPIPTIPTGFPKLDYLLRGGMAKGQVTSVMARTSVGKSAFVLNVAVDVAVRQRIPVLFLSLEMSARQLYERMLTSMTFSKHAVPTTNLVEFHGVNSYNMRRDRLTEDELKALSTAKQKLGDSPITVEDNPGIGPRLLHKACRQWMRKTGGGLVVVDYLQAMKADGPNETNYARVWNASDAIRLAAREFNVPVIQAVQLNRNAASSGRPAMHHAEGAGKIEQDSYAAIVIDRPDLRDGGKGVNDFQRMPMEKLTAPQAVMYLDKNRNGQAGGHLYYRFCGPVTRFVEEEH